MSKHKRKMITYIKNREKLMKMVLTNNGQQHIIVRNHTKILGNAKKE